MSILGPDGGVALTASGKEVKKPILDIRMVLFPKMMVHPETKQMVMVPMQDLQYQREGCNEWFSVAIHETEKHEFNPEEKKNEEVSSTSPSGVILS